MKNQNVKNYQIERREQLIEAGLTESEARKIAFAETQKELLVRVHDTMLDDVIKTAFLLGLQFQKQRCEGKTNITQYQALNNAKSEIRQMLHN